MNESKQKQDSIELASQWQLIWWRFRKHRIAMIGLVITSLFYIIVAIAGFIAPYEKTQQNSKYTYAPPQKLHFFHETEQGKRFGRPYVYGYEIKRDEETWRKIYEIDKTQKQSFGFFIRGHSYKLLGFIPWDIHLFGTINGNEPTFLLGADHMGRDLLSRAIHATRISMTIGLVGVTLSLFFGVFFGGISGYFGGVIDNIIQRIIELLRSIPTIPLWMGLAAAIPDQWTPLQVYFAITIILSLRGWTGLARVVRGRFISLKTEDFVTAARLDGASQWRIMFYHMVPSFISHIIAATTLAIPRMIISETALSFLGIGLRAPVVSWGVLLETAQNIQSIAKSPWLLFVPGVLVIIAVLSLNFLGDGLRDAADPYD